MSTDTLTTIIGADPIGQTVLSGGQGPEGPEGDPGLEGPPGAPGASVLNGLGAPGAGVGSNGDFYINTSTWTIHGPKAAGAWPAGVALRGTDGAAGDSGGVLDGVWRRPEFVNTDTYLTGALTGSRLYLTRHRVPRDAKLKSLKWWNGPNSVLSGRSAKALVYTPGTNGWPSVRAYVSAAQALSNSNSTYTLSAINVNIDAGDCWIGLVFDAAISASSNLAGLSARYAGFTTDPISGSGSNVDAIAYDSSYSSPADPIGSLTRVNLNGNTCPLIYPEWDRR